MKVAIMLVYKIWIKKFEFLWKLFPFHDFQNNPIVFPEIQSQGDVIIVSYSDCDYYIDSVQHKSLHYDIWSIFVKTSCLQCLQDNNVFSVPP